MYFLFITLVISTFCKSKYLIPGKRREKILEELATVTTPREMQQFLQYCGVDSRFTCKGFMSSKMDIKCLNSYLEIYAKDTSGELLQQFVSQDHKFLELQVLHYLILKSVIDNDIILFDIVVNSIQRIKGRRYNLYKDLRIVNMSGGPEWSLDTYENIVDDLKRWDLISLAYYMKSTAIIWKLLPFYESNKEFGKSRVAFAIEGLCDTDDIIMKNGRIFEDYKYYIELFTELSLQPKCKKQANSYFGSSNRKFSVKEDNYLLETTKLNAFSTLPLIRGSLTSSFPFQNQLHLALKLSQKTSYLSNAQLSDLMYWRVIVLSYIIFSYQTKAFARKGISELELLDASVDIDYESTLEFVKQIKSWSKELLKYGITPLDLKLMINLILNREKEIQNSLHPIEPLIFIDLLEQNKWENTRLAIHLGHKLGFPKTTLKNELTKHILEVASGKHVCSICMDDISKIDINGILDCGHAYHYNCIKEWVYRKPTCPICKNKVKYF